MARKSLVAAAAGLVALLAGASYWHFQEHGTSNLTSNPVSPKVPAAPLLNWLAASDTLAGDGLRGFADGNHAAARFADPFGLAEDSHGNIYVSDAGDNNKIRKIAPDGSVTTFAGSVEGFADGNGSAAAFNTPSGLAIDEADNLYVADTGNNAIRKISPQGVVTTVAGDGRAGTRDGAARQARFNGPLGLDVDRQGNIYVADSYNDSVRRIAADGQVTTLAGGHAPGFQDGPAQIAQFDTPCAVKLDAHGNLLIADTRNNAVRRMSLLGSNDQVVTLARSLPEEHDALMRRPTSLTLAQDGMLYVGDMAHGRIVQLAPNGELGALQETLNTTAVTDPSLRFARPTAVLHRHDGSLLVADATAYRVVSVVPAHAGVGETISAGQFAVQRAALRAAQVTQNAQQIIAALPAVVSKKFPWPFKPQFGTREIVGTLGEVRGNHDGESRDHLHGGLDVQAAMGTTVLAVADEKVSSPVSTWTFGETGEGMSLDLFSYIHMRVGRTAEGKPIDPARFLIRNDDQGQASYVRVKRGTRFATGDALGTVNRMYHTHLALHAAGTEINPLVLPFPGIHDDIPPTIRQIQIADPEGRVYGKQENGRLLLPVGGRFDIVVEAYDQMNGNQKRRQLGLYRLGYQLLNADGSALPGYEKPLVTMDFLCLPDDSAAVKIAYAGDSGITVYGSASTRMRYQVSNRVRDGLASRDVWDSKGMAPGNYILRIYAADFASNVALAGRDVPIAIGP